MRFARSLYTATIVCCLLLLFSSYKSTVVEAVGYESVSRGHKTFIGETMRVTKMSADGKIETYFSSSPDQEAYLNRRNAANAPVKQNVTKEPVKLHDYKIPRG
eukprot:Lankesteria_metandrocarpae@DN2919_c0_g1_i2.p1